MLVVEDETNLAEAIAYNLRREGYDASTAVDGYSGLDAALVQRPEVRVLDLMLPGLDGLELCRRLRRRSAVPIIMLKRCDGAGHQDRKPREAKKRRSRSR
ncbi:MAG TPA: response regulator [Gemmataceae bacterium]|nr:response regulator [Gemmataceae bacterium]